MNRICIRHFVLCFIFPVFVLNAEENGVFQYAIPEDEVFLWLPPEAERIEGILVAGNTSIEKHVVRDPRVRAVCRQRNLAIVFGMQGLNRFFDQSMLDRLAEVSGYGELTDAPLFFAGHSAGGPQAKEQAAAFGDRTFGLMLSRGGLPDPGASFPTLVLAGQFDEFSGVMREKDGREPAWEDPRDALMRVLEADREIFVSFAVEAGAGHFGWSPRNAELFAQFLDAAAARDAEAGLAPLPFRGNAIPVPHATGWTRQPNRAFAEALTEYHAPLFQERKDQFLRWENRHWVDAGVRHFFHELDFTGDGQVFRVNPVFAGRVPGQPNNRGPQWPGAGEEVGNAGGDIHIRMVNGPAIVEDGHLIRLRHDALNPANAPPGRITFLAYSEGNGTYRRTELPGMAPRGFRGPRGASQSVDFEELPASWSGREPLPLRARASSGLPVNFYVARGPAVVRNNHLHVSQVPGRAANPIEIEVVAYQPGSGAEPRFSPASGVSHTVRLNPLDPDLRLTP